MATHKTPLLLALAGLLSFSVSAQKVRLEKAWETPAELITIESAYYNKAENVIYTSNIEGKPLEKDGKGSIGKVSPEGKILQAQWVTGLNAPKGMGVSNGKLYVTDIDQLRIIDIKTGQVEKTIDVPGSKFLNDVTVDGRGKVYFTDMQDAALYTLKGDKAVKINCPAKAPNGVEWHEGTLALVDGSDEGWFYVSSTGSPMDFKKLVNGFDNGDGIVRIKEGYIVSKWRGEIHFISNQGKVSLLLDTQKDKLNTADIGAIRDTNLLLVPTFFGNTLAAYKIIVE